MALLNNQMMTLETQYHQPKQELISPSSPAISLQGIQVRYRTDTPVVLGIEALSITPGERVAIIGPSGSAKTTLLRLINGYIQPEVGHVTVLGHKIDRSGANRRRVGFVFQDFNLIERATVFQNVLWGRLGRVNPFLSLFGWFSNKDKQLAMQAIVEVDLIEQASQRADTLSGGQQQRVAVARVLAQEAEIILADEPVSNLDPALADDILDLLVKVSQKRGATLIMSVHQPALAQRYAERIIGLRQGRLIFDGRSGSLNPSILRTIYGREIDLRSATAIAHDSIQSSQEPQPVPDQAEPEISL